jgi:molecular chaperone GrpE (heat shock protein)
LKQPLLLAYEANSVHKKIFDTSLKSNQEITKSCQAAFAVLLFLSIPTEAVQDPKRSDGISAKVRRDFLEAVPVDVPALFKRALEELSVEQQPGTKRANLSIRLCQLIVAADEGALETTKDARSWHFALREVSAVHDVLAVPAAAVCINGFADSLRADTEPDTVKEVLATMRDDDLTLSTKKQKLFTWLLSKGVSIADLEDACASITLSTWLAASRSEFVSKLNPSIVDRITHLVIDNFDHKTTSNSDFGLYVNSAPRVAALVPESVVDALFAQASRTLPALKLVAERLKTSGDSVLAVAQMSATREELAAKDQALQLLARQMTTTMAALEKSQADLLRVRSDFQQQFESSRSNLVHKLAESLAGAISEMESQFGIATLEQTSGRLLARMKALGVEKLNQTGETVGFEPGLHESKDRACAEGELVQVIAPGFVYTYENQRRVLIKSVVS